MEYLERRLSALKPSHVYISFGGGDGEDDTCKFIRSLSAALKAEGFRIFGDDKRLETPDSNLPHHLLQAIRKSWIRIAVFSKNYASSSWCLQELAEFSGLGRRKPRIALCGGAERPQTRMEDKMRRWSLDLKQPSRGLRVGDRTIAVYYDVDPNSFPQHIQHLSGQEIEQVASLSGCHVRNDSGPQVIQKIVKEVKSKIDKRFYDIFGYVGIQSQVEEVEKLLDLRKDDEVGVVGICGMGGLGKSTIAAVLYLKIFHYFDAFCFLPNVSERLRQGDLSLQELLHRNLESENSEISHTLGQEFLAGKMLRNHKFLIVLDGVDLVQHLQELNLAEKSNCFGGGSRIIITTRDEQVLQEYEVDTVYRPKLLSKDEAFQLFRSQAFIWEYPIDDFKEMIDKVLEYADGLPLAIEKLGSSCFEKGIAEWRNYLDREEIIPPDEIIRVLKKSYDELDDMSKEMFLDIACFFVGKDIYYVKEILHDCISCRIDTEVLVQKSIITIEKQRIKMHTMLQAMGWEIIRQQCPNQPDKRSRLYRFSDVKYVMEKERNKVVNDVEAIALDLDEQKLATLRIDALSDMINLRLLIFHNVKCFGTLDNLSSELRYISWHRYPFMALPSSFQSDTLVQLIMPESNMTEVWKGKMVLPKLRKMDLCGSINLTKTPDFGGVPNLERLELEKCTKLLRLGSSIANLSNLKSLNLKNCINLISIPNSLFSHDNSLEVLNLAGCSKLAYCLEFSPIKSFIQVKLLGIWDSPFLETLLYFLLLVLPKQKNYQDFVCCCLIYLICICEVNYVDSSYHES